MKKIILLIILSSILITTTSCGKADKKIVRDEYGYVLPPSNVKIGKTTRKEVVKIEGEPYGKESSPGKKQEDYYKVTFDDVTIEYEYLYKYISNTEPDIFSGYSASYKPKNDEWQDIYQNLKERIIEKYGSPEDDVNTEVQEWNGDSYDYYIECYAMWYVEDITIKIEYDKRGDIIKAGFY